MHLLLKRYLVALSIFSVFAGLVLAVELGGRRPQRNVNIFRIPAHVDGWSAREMPVDEGVRETLETKAVLMREYMKDGRKVLLTIVYYPDSRVALHLPESCYSGQGSKIVERGTECLCGFEANRFLLEGDKGNKLVLYYFATGELSTSSYRAMRLEMLMNRLKGRAHGCALVRLSLNRTGDAGGDMSVLKEFADSMQRVIPNYLR